MHEINNTVFRVIDCETTGVDHKADRVIEMAYADIRADGEVMRRFQSLYDPGIPIPATASAIHHLTDEDCAGCPSWISERDSHEAPVYVAHNAEFDSAMLGLKGLWLCAYRLAKHLWPDLASHGNEAIRYALKLKPETVKGAASHRAVNDVAVTAAILVRALTEARKLWPDLQTVETLISRVQKPCLLRIVPFKSANSVTFEKAETGLLQWIVQKQAGGDDCIHSARHWLDKRYGEAIQSSWNY